ncbi:MAG: helix-turn-helix transcriptional regulator [Clostridia bacterium]|nr:helix-turn-helix transcriptional regulator [Clostridia bacterium]
MTIADRIRNRRIELGLSVDDLAKLLQKNRATVYRYESNYIKSYSPDVLESLAKALQTTPAYFYGYEDGPESSEIDPEIHIVSGMMETMTKEQKQQVIDLVRILMKTQK